MKPVITKEDVSKAMSQLLALGKKPTLAALHASLDNKGSMSTLVRLKAEIEAEAKRPEHPPGAFDAFSKLWSIAHEEARKAQEQTINDLQDTIRTMAAENERLDAAVAILQIRAQALEEAKSANEHQLGKIRSNCDHELSQASTAIRRSSLQAEKSLNELAEARRVHAVEVARLQADLTKALHDSHEFELELVRARALVDARAPTRNGSAARIENPGN